MTARDPGEPFLARWSRLKRGEDVVPEPAGPEEAERGPEQGAGSGVAEEARAREAPVAPEDLPDPDTLDANADFRIFLREGVPEELQRRALRRLWRLNPIISAVDPLVDYGEDFTDAATVLSDLKTAYKVGRGMLDRLAGEEHPAAGEGGKAETAEVAEEPQVVAGPEDSSDKSGSDA